MGARKRDQGQRVNALTSLMRQASSWRRVRVLWARQQFAGRFAHDHEGVKTEHDVANVKVSFVVCWSGDPQRLMSGIGTERGITCSLRQ